MCIYPSQREAAERLSYVLYLCDHVMCIRVTAVSHPLCWCTIRADQVLPQSCLWYIYRSHERVGTIPTNSPNAAHMHRDVQCYTSPVPSYDNLLFLHWNTRGASNSCTGLYGCIRYCIGHGNVAEVVLANSLDSVCVCSMWLAVRTSARPAADFTYRLRRQIRGEPPQS